MIHHSHKYNEAKIGEVYYVICQRPDSEWGINNETDEFVDKYYVIAARLCGVSNNWATVRYVDGKFEGGYIDTKADLVCNSTVAYAVCDLLNCGWEMTDIPLLSEIHSLSTT